MEIKENNRMYSEEDFNRAVEEERKKIILEYEKKIKEAGKSKTDFLLNMSHDLRTPMNAIVGFTQIALKNTNDRYMVTDCLTKVRSASNYLLTLLNDVLDIAKIEQGKLSIEEDEVILADLLVELENIVEESAEEKQLNVSFVCGNLKCDTVWADQLHLTRVLMNIISNAVKYTRPGGNVEVSLEERPDGSEHSGTYVFTVKDNGIGMTEEFVEHIYEQFSRERSTTLSGIQGTGLGMAITKQLVDMMNGQIQIDSKLGVGTTITVSFPFRYYDDKKQRSEMKKVMETGSVNLEGMHVLVAEDNLLNREIAMDILSDLGVTVDEAEDGAKAVEKIKNSKPGYYHLVLMDIQMPYMDGYKATSTIRSLEDPVLSSVPIVALSANVFPEDRQKSEESGMNGHLSKPFVMSELIQTLMKYAPEGVGKVRETGEAITDTRSDIEDRETKAEDKEYTVLIVDDSEINRRFLNHMLKEKYNVVEAVNGSEALAILYSGKIPVHLVVLDLSMPVMTGFEFMEEWKKDPKLSQIPVMVETAGTYSDGELTSLKLGASDFVKRPFQSEIVLHRIANVIKNRYEKE